MLFPGMERIGVRELWQIKSRLPMFFASGSNKGATDFWMGAAVARDASGSGFTLANNAAVATTAIGLACLGSHAGQPEIVQLDGLFSLDDWTPVTGAINLTPLAFYWLDSTSGKLTSVMPVGPAISTLVGLAISTRTLKIGIEQLAAIGLAGPAGPAGPPGPAGPGAKNIVGYKTADQNVFSSTVFVNCTDISFAIGANEAWNANFVLFVSDGGIAGNFKMQFTGPAGASVVVYTGIETRSFLDATGKFTAFSTSTTLPDAGVWGIDGVWWFNLNVVNGVNAGTVQLQFAQVASNIVGCRVFKGSSFIATKLN